MGTYFNPDNDSFREIINSQIYVDKTGLLNEMNKAVGTQQKCIALSHARRFGKTQVARMIDAYYSLGSDSKEIFSKYEIAKSPDFSKYLNKYNVIHLDIASFWDTYKDDIVEQIKRILYEEFTAVYPNLMSSENPIGRILKEITEFSGTPFVIIIDEWDCIVRDAPKDKDLVHHYLQFLHSLFKSEESGQFLALAYITGILPIKKIQDESALNNFREFTMISSEKMTPYYGFTEEEVKTLCDRYNMPFESVKEWYDGYLIDGYQMYNPNSVVQAMLDEKCKSYWKDTSSFGTINTYIELDYTGLKEDVLTMLNGGFVPVDPLGFRNDLSIINSKDDALTALIHLGYLGYDNERRRAYIPNYEVGLAFQAAISNDGKWTEIAATLKRCDELLFATIDGEAEKVAELLELSHETYSSVIKYNDENSLACAIRMAYFTAPAYYEVINELPTGKGFADIVMRPRKDSIGKPAMIIELKWNKSADTAIKQIKEKRYTGRLKDYEDEILLVGVSYTKKTKKHRCVIERYRNSESVE